MTTKHLIYILSLIVILSNSLKIDSANGACINYIAFDTIEVVSPDSLSPESYSNNIYIVNNSTNKVIKISAGEEDSFVDWSPDGQFIAYKSVYNRPNLLIYDRQSQSISEILDGQNTPIFDLNWSPNGQFIAFISTNPNYNQIQHLYIYQVMNGAIQNLTPNLDFHALDINWNPNNIHIVIQVWTPDLDSLYIINIQDGQQIILENSFNAQWYEDGRILRFAKEQDGIVSFYGYNMQTGEIQILGEEARGIRSFDNQYAAYYQDGIIHLRNLNTGEIEILQSGFSESYATNFVWSPYSLEIAFFEPEVDEIETLDGGYIYIKNLETGEVRNALGDYALYTAPLGALGWSPCIVES